MLITAEFFLFMLKPHHQMSVPPLIQRNVVNVRLLLARFRDSLQSYFQVTPRTRSRHRDLINMPVPMQSDWFAYVNTTAMCTAVIPLQQ